MGQPESDEPLDGAAPVSSAPKQPSLSERPLSEKWRKRALLCQTEGLRDDRAMHRAIVFDECAAEYDAERAELVRELGEVLREWRNEGKAISAGQPSGTPQIRRNALYDCADALAALLTRRGMRGTQGEA